MSRNTISPDEAEAELARLGEYDLDRLKARWLELKGVPLPKFMRRGLMTLAVAHAIRETAWGGLDKATQRELDALAARIVPSGERPPPQRRKVRAGTRLIREWQGEVHEVVVVTDGFLWNGTRHRSLSAIARQITGTRWNGWVFFGLRPATPEPARGRGKGRSAASRKGARTKPPTPSSPPSSRPRGEGAHV